MTIPVRNRCDMEDLMVPFGVKFQLISLICLVKEKSHRANKDLEFRYIIDKLAPNYTTSKLKEELEWICRMLYVEGGEYNNFGTKNLSEIKNKVAGILENQLPF